MSVKWVPGLVYVSRYPIGDKEVLVYMCTRPSSKDTSPFMRDDTIEDEWMYGTPNTKHTSEQDLSNKHIPQSWKRELYYGNTWVCPPNFLKYTLWIYRVKYDKWQFPRRSWRYIQYIYPRVWNGNTFIWIIFRLRLLLSIFNNKLSALQFYIAYQNTLTHWGRVMH